jgi:hypothetical protein
MTHFKHLVAAALAALVFSSSALAATPAEQVAQAPSAMDGIDAEAMGAAEMDAVHGALTGQDLFDRLLASASLIRDPALRARAVAYLTANQANLVAFFNRILSFR